jgi:hypothetical protein
MIILFLKLDVQLFAECLNIFFIQKDFNLMHAKWKLSMFIAQDFYLLGFLSFEMYINKKQSRRFFIYDIYIFKIQNWVKTFFCSTRNQIATESIFSNENFLCLN